ncbi:hypothetical protein NKH47_04045 [Mesorhizobium sp. M1060]|uniref:GIY-YIG nuclease family protein n=1 Tax=unclassified Mesorhizobium TaxID=325217 RepID=UPI0003CFB856|nr:MULTISPECIES: GIY-YIG nuclease family protein [unclassified Mesorhizobium]ESZ04408.1 hypothetical protein X736_22030 [Mesorhizobium sp. L2C089B000]WJI52347.1 hypothetical protein NLY44_06645 [Mesorhizobium sp. C089B]
MKLFATRVWGFGFARLPLATFGIKGNVDRLLNLAKRGDRLIFVGTQTERTAPELQGRILGMAEIGFEPLRTLDLVERNAFDPRDFDAVGNFKFPYAVATTRVWQFEPAPVLTRLLSRQLTMVATAGVEEIDDPADVAAIKALNAVEIDLPKLPALERMRRLNDALRNTTGPRPTDTSYQVSRSAIEGEAWAYGLRYGDRDVWKIGWADDIDERCATVNQHIPVELGGLEQWSVEFRQRMKNRDAAYKMEQRVLTLLDAKRKGFERVHCTHADLQSAWTHAFLNVIQEG